VVGVVNPLSLLTPMSRTRAWVSPVAHVLLLLTGPLNKKKKWGGGNEEGSEEDRVTR